MAASPGRGSRASSALVTRIIPGVQYPHCAADSSANARCTGCRPATPAAAPGSARPSIVVTARPATDPAVIWQDLTGSPSISTVHAPQAPSPQPGLAPVRPRRSRTAASSGIEPGSSAVRPVDGDGDLTVHGSASS